MDASAPPKVHKSILRFYFEPANCLTRLLFNWTFLDSKSCIISLAILDTSYLISIFWVHIHVYDDILGIYDTAWYRSDPDRNCPRVIAWDQKSASSSIIFILVFKGRQVASFGWVLRFRVWVLRFRDLGASFSSFGCFVFEIWVLPASVFVFECFVFETTDRSATWPLLYTNQNIRQKSIDDKLTLLEP